MDESEMSGTDAIYLHIFSCAYKRVGCEFIMSIDFWAATTINRTNQKAAAAYFSKSGHRHDILWTHTMALGEKESEQRERQSVPVLYVSVPTVDTIGFSRQPLSLTLVGSDGHCILTYTTSFLLLGASNQTDTSIVVL